MATAVLNGLTNNRHSSCMQKLKSFEDRKPSPAETSSTGTGGGGGEDGKGLQDLSMIDSENKSVADLGDVHHLESNQLAKGGDMCKENSEWGSESGEVSSERSKSADLRDADSKSREVSVEMSEVSVERSGSEEVGRDISRDSTSEKGSCSAPSLEIDTSSSVIGDKLMQTSSLLTQLQARQKERLALPSYKADLRGHLLLPPPTHEEVGVAREVRQKLATLTAMAQPDDVVSVGSLHTAMGVAIQTTRPSSTTPGPGSSASQATTITAPAEPSTRNQLGPSSTANPEPISTPTPP